MTKKELFYSLANVSVSLHSICAVYKNMRFLVLTRENR